MAKRTRFIAYYRVSTAKQGRSGLGLEAQREAVRSFIASENGGAQLIGEYVEVESGKRSENRPQLAKALAAMCRGAAGRSKCGQALGRCAETWRAPEVHT